jgi:hypothetical protein
VNTRDIIKRWGTEYLDRYNNDLLSALKKIYPEHNWVIFFFSFKNVFNLKFTSYFQVYPKYSVDDIHPPWKGRLPRAELAVLCDILRELFPKDQIIQLHEHDQITDPTTKSNIQFDVWLPRYSLAMDFHAEYTYHFSAVFGNAELSTRKIEAKAEITEKNGIYYVGVCDSFVLWT